MTITTLSSREFSQSVSEAKRAAINGPVLITDGGRPAHVLMSIELYQRLTGNNKKIADLLTMPSIAEVDFETPRSRDVAKSWHDPCHAKRGRFSIIGRDDSQPLGDCLG